MDTTPSKPKMEYTKVREMVYELKVRDAALKEVIAITGETLMSELGEILHANRISGTPVMEDEKLIGIISIEDFINWLADGEEDCPVNTKMTTGVQTLYANEPLIHAVSKLGASSESLPSVGRIVRIESV